MSLTVTNKPQQPLISNGQLQVGPPNQHLQAARGLPLQAQGGQDQQAPPPMQGGFAQHAFQPAAGINPFQPQGFMYNQRPSGNILDYINSRVPLNNPQTFNGFQTPLVPMMHVPLLPRPMAHLAQLRNPQR